MKTKMQLSNLLNKAKMRLKIQRKRRKMVVSIMFTLKDGTSIEIANRVKMKKWILRIRTCWQQFNYLRRNKNNNWNNKRITEKCKLNSLIIQIKKKMSTQSAFSSKQASVLMGTWFRPLNTNLQFKHRTYRTMKATNFDILISKQSNQID